MLDSTVNLKVWIPPEKSHTFTVAELRRLLNDVPPDFIVTIDDMNWIFHEIDWEDRRIDFFRDYKGD